MNSNPRKHGIARVVLTTLVVGVPLVGFIAYQGKQTEDDYPYGRRVSGDELSRTLLDYAYWRGRHDAANLIDPLVGADEQREIRLSLRESRYSDLIPIVHNSHRGTIEDRRRTIAERIRTTPDLLTNYDKGFGEQSKLMSDKFKIPEWDTFLPSHSEFYIAFPGRPDVATNVVNGITVVTYAVRLDHWRSFAVHRFSGLNAPGQVDLGSISDAILNRHQNQGRSIISDTVSSNSVAGSFRTIRAESRKDERLVDQRLHPAAGLVYVLEVIRQTDQIRDVEAESFLNSFRVRKQAPAVGTIWE